jgi:hypothetical protein
MNTYNMWERNRSDLPDALSNRILMLTSWFIIIILMKMATIKKWSSQQNTPYQWGYYWLEIIQTTEHSTWKWNIPLHCYFDLLECHITYPHITVPTKMLNSLCVICPLVNPSVPLSSSSDTWYLQRHIPLIFGKKLWHDFSWEDLI